MPYLLDDPTEGGGKKKGRGERVLEILRKKQSHEKKEGKQKKKKTGGENGRPLAISFYSDLRGEEGVDWGWNQRPS